MHGVAQAAAVTRPWRLRGAGGVTWNGRVTPGCRGEAPTRQPSQEAAYESLLGKRLVKPVGGSVLKLRDGPAKGVYPCHRAPYFLRAVLNPKTGKFNVLDQVDHQAAVGEHISDIYRRVGDASRVHLCTGGKGSGYYAAASYERVPGMVGVEIEYLRDTAVWRQWCLDSRPDVARATEKEGATI